MALRQFSGTASLLPSRGAGTDSDSDEPRTVVVRRCASNDAAGWMVRKTNGRAAQTEHIAQLPGAQLAACAQSHWKEDKQGYVDTRALINTRWRGTEKRCKSNSPGVDTR